MTTRAQLKAFRSYYERLRKKVFDVLGRKCSNADCKWQNDDGSIGCTDERLLQIDHRNGGGTKEARGKGGRCAMLRRVLEHPDEYQVLCANCNWLKRLERGEHIQRLKWTTPLL